METQNNGSSNSSSKEDIKEVIFFKQASSAMFSENTADKITVDVVIEGNENENECENDNVNVKGNDEKKDINKVLDLEETTTELLTTVNSTDKITVDVVVSKSTGNIVDNEVPPIVPPPPLPPTTGTGTTEVGTIQVETAQEATELIPADDDDDLDNEPDETLSERLWGLTEMFPESVRRYTSRLGLITKRNASRIYATSCRATWFIVTTAFILFGPVIFESERAQLRELQKSHEKQVLFGPSVAISGRN